VRIDRLVEAIQLLKRAWGGEPFTWQGAHYRVTDYAGRPLPVQRPRPPLLIASGSPRLLGIAAREAEIVALAPRPARDGTRLIWHSISAAATASKIEWVRAAAPERFSDLTLSCNVVEVEITDDLAGASARLGAKLGCEPALLEQSPHVWIGSVERIAERLHAQRERYGISYYTVLGDLDLLAATLPVVAALAGR
jgi:alkanesulfonate monooxygenase SsuD/methylene tetrahydromethanopterin reductase-like flavin-dependent oxidoreductase (luciferase family)